MNEFGELGNDLQADKDQESQDFESHHVQELTEPHFIISNDALANYLGVSLSQINDDQAEVSTEFAIAKYASEYGDKGQNVRSTYNVVAQLERGKQVYQEFLDKVAPKEGVITRGLRALSRARAVRETAEQFSKKSKLDARTQSEQLISHMESLGSSAIFGERYEDSQYIHYIKNYDALRSPQWLALISQLNDPLRTIQNAESLFGPSWHIDLLYRSRSQQVAYLLQEIEKVPQATIDSVGQRLAILNGVKVSPMENYQPDSNIAKDIECIINICKNGGFNQNELLLLDRADQLARIFPNEFPVYSISELLENPQYISSLLEVSTILIKRLNSGDDYIKTKLFLVCDAIVRHKLPITSELLEGLEKSQVKLDLDELRQQIKAVYGEAEPYFADQVGVLKTLDVKQEIEDIFEVLPEYQISTLSTEEQKKYYQYLTRKQHQLLDDPLLTQAHLLALHSGETLTSKNMFFYHDQALLIQKCARQIAKLAPEEKCSLLLGSSNFNDIPQLGGDVYIQFMAHYFPDFDTVSLDKLDTVGSNIYKALRTLLLSDVSEDMLESILLNKLALSNNLSIHPVLLEQLPTAIRVKIEWWQDLPEGAKTLLTEEPDLFSSFFVQGKETEKLIKYLAHSLNNTSFVEYLTKERLSLLYGPEKSERFLSALPKKNDERRNALTHNPYDRTSELLIQFANQGQIDFSDPEMIDTLTEFIETFGLARSTQLYDLFKSIKLFETGRSETLPLMAAESQVKTVAELLQEYEELKTLIMSNEPLTGDRLRNLSVMQMQLLEVISGKTTHRFDFDRPSFRTIVSDYIVADSQGEISSVPEGFRTARFDLKNVTISFDAGPIKDDYQLLKSEVLDSITQSENVDDLVAELVKIVEKKITETENGMEAVPEKGKVYAQKNLDNLHKLKVLLTENRLDLDGLLVLLLDSNLGKSEQSVENSLKRKIIFRKIFQHHFSPAFIEDLQTTLSSDISPQGVLSILNLIDEMVKQHALNLNANQEGVSNYWSTETVTALKTSKNGRKLFDIFAGVKDKFKKAVDEFEYLESANSTSILAIPNRDFTAEVSGYIADVCYTKEYPLLKNREVVPYKFVKEGDDLKSSEFGGSVLIFDVVDEHGQECLLVRAFDYINENTINISQFIESFLDEMEHVAKFRNKKKVLVPGVQGAISNYHLTISHIRNKYCLPTNRITLKDKFDFNEYDLTNECYVARTVR